MNLNLLVFIRDKQRLVSDWNQLNFQLQCGSFLFYFTLNED